LRLRPGGGELGQLEGVAGEVGVADDLVALVVVAEDHEAPAESPARLDDAVLDLLRAGGGDDLGQRDLGHGSARFYIGTLPSWKRGGTGCYAGGGCYDSRGRSSPCRSTGTSPRACASFPMAPGGSASSRSSIPPRCGTSSRTSWWRRRGRRAWWTAP